MIPRMAPSLGSFGSCRRVGADVDATARNCQDRAVEHLRLVVCRGEAGGSNLALAEAPLGPSSEEESPGIRCRNRCGSSFAKRSCHDGHGLWRGRARERYHLMRQKPSRPPKKEL
ncbi:unnamed protein product [Discosporangium mesarthrocarpum]